MSLLPKGHLGVWIGSLVVLTGIGGTLLFRSLAPQPTSAKRGAPQAQQQLRVRLEQDVQLRGEATWPAPQKLVVKEPLQIQVPLNGIANFRLRDGKTGELLGTAQPPVAGTADVRVTESGVAVGLELQESADLTVNIPEFQWSCSIGWDGAELNWRRSLTRHTFVELGVERQFREDYRAKVRLGVKF